MKATAKMDRVAAVPRRGEWLPDGFDIMEGIEGNELLAAVFEQAGEGMLVYDLHGRVVRVNSAWCDMFGFTGPEITGTVVLPVSDQGAVTRFMIPRRRHLQLLENRRTNYEGEFVGSEGMQIPCEVSASVVEYGDDDYCLLTFRDVSKFQKRLSELEESQTRLKRLVDQLPVIVYTAAIGENSRTTYSGVQIWKILGYRSEEAEGDPEFWVRKLHPDDRKRVAKELVTSHRQGNRFVSEYRFAHACGHYVWIRDEAEVERDVNGKALYIRGIMLDITDRKLAEEELRLARDELEQRVAERTTALAEAKDRAEQAVKFKSAFLSTLSHEFRTPLNSIIGFSSVLLNGMAGKLNAEQVKQLGMIKGRADHLQGLLTDVLDLSRIEVGKLDIVPGGFDIGEKLRGWVDSMRPQTDIKGLELIAEIPDTPMPVVSDERRLQQIVLNLLSNAAKFTSDGSVKVTLKSGEEGFQISVADTGAGIAEDDREGIFVAFTQGRIGSQRRHPGSGLGLSISRELTQLLGGEIRLESEIGGGSTFTVLLPRQVAIQREGEC